MNTKILYLIAQNGLGFGLALCFYSVFMWLTHLDAEYLYIGQYLDILVVVVPIFFIFRAIKQVSQQTNIKIGYRLFIALGVGLVGYLVHTPYLYAYHNFINPDWFDAVLALEKENLLAKNIPMAEINTKLQAMSQKNNEQNKLFKLNTFVASVLILPLLISLLSLIFIRNPKNV